VVISAENRYVCLADGRKVPFEEYTEQSREFILDISHKGFDELLRIWIDKGSRQELREALRDRDIYPAAFRHYLDLPDADDVDILAKIGFQLPRVPNRADRANRLWDHDQIWLLDQVGEKAICPKPALQNPSVANRAGPLPPVRHRRPRTGAHLRRPAICRAVRQLHHADPALRRPGPAQGRPRTGEATPLRAHGRLMRPGPAKQQGST
jgi:hypothetical protein